MAVPASSCIIRDRRLSRGPGGQWRQRRVLAWGAQGRLLPCCSCCWRAHGACCDAGRVNWVGAAGAAGFVLQSCAGAGVMLGQLQEQGQVSAGLVTEGQQYGCQQDLTRASIATVPVRYSSRRSFATVYWPTSKRLEKHVGCVQKSRSAVSGACRKSPRPKSGLVAHQRCCILLVLLIQVRAYQAGVLCHTGSTQQ